MCGTLVELRKVERSWRAVILEAGKEEVGFEVL
jgi:hypothetical protein